jgi:hypothetical protein
MLQKKGNLFHVMDGGALLHRVPWFKGESYSVIFKDTTNILMKTSNR